MPRPSTLPDPWLSLAAKLGSVQALAGALLCDTRTLHRWAHGDTQPDRRAALVIRSAFERAGLMPPSL